MRSLCLPSPPCGAELELPAMVVVASEVGEWSECGGGGGEASRRFCA